MAEATRPRPKPRPRARAPASVSTESATGLSDVNATTQASNTPAKAPVNAVDEDDGDDLFAYRRRLMRKLASQTIKDPSPPPPVPAHGSGSEQEDSTGRKRKRSKKREEADWVRSGVQLASDKAVREGEEASDEDEVEDEDKGADQGSKGSISANRKGTPSYPPGEPLTSPLSDTDPHTDISAPFHMPDFDSDDDEEDASLPAPDPDLIAKIQARHLTAKALSGSDVRFGGESSLGTGSKCQVMVEPKIDPGKAADMEAVERGKWGTKKAFDAPRDEPLTLIYETVGQVLGIPNPSSNIIMEFDNGTRIWSCYATPNSLKFPDTKVTLFAYERSHYEQVETARKEAERIRFQNRVANNEKSPTPEPTAAFTQITADASKTRPAPLAFNVPTATNATIPSTEPIEIDSDSEPETQVTQPVQRAADYSSDIEILDSAPKPNAFVLAPRHTDTAGSEPPTTPSSISVQIRGQEGELTGNVSSTTTYDAVIKYYASKMSIPVELPATGRGKNRIPGKKLKIDFDGDLFDGAGKILELDLDGGETLDIKYV